MTSFIQNMLWNSVSGFVEAGTRTVGGYAGDALIKAGDMVEGGGRSVGNSIERKATGLGSSISGQTHTPSAKALPSTARRPAAHRSNSLPPSSKPGSGGSGVPLGGKKYGVVGAGAAKMGGGTNGAKSAAGGATAGVVRGAGGVKPVGGVVKPAGGVVGRANSTGAALGRGLKSANGNLIGGAGKNLPTRTNTGLPKPYGSENSYPSSGKKTAVRPGQSKVFTPPQEKDDGKKFYPGTKTLPGQGNRVPVKKYKPAQRYEPPAKAGEATFF